MVELGGLSPNFFEGAARSYATSLNVEDLIRPSHGGQSVGNRDRRHAPFQLGKRLDDGKFRLRV